MSDPLLDYRPTTPGLEPECEVLVDDTWHPGFIRGWYRYADHWTASVQYSTEPGSNRLAVFPTDKLRQVVAPGLEEQHPDHEQQERQHRQQHQDHTQGT